MYFFAGFFLMESHLVYDQRLRVLVLSFPHFTDISDSWCIWKNTIPSGFGGTLPWKMEKHLPTYPSSDLFLVPMELLCTKWVTKVKPDIN